MKPYSLIHNSTAQVQRSTAMTAAAIVMAKRVYQSKGRASYWCEQARRTSCAPGAAAFSAGPHHLPRRLVLAHALIDDLAHQALIGPGEILHLHDQFPGVVNRPAKSVTIKQIRARGAGSY